MKVFWEVVENFLLHDGQFEKLKTLTGRQAK
jgi:hypothetical protein